MGEPVYSLVIQSITAKLSHAYKLCDPKQVITLLI